MFRISCALLGVALLLSACGDSGPKNTTPPPGPAAPVTDLAGIGIAVYAPPVAYKGTLSGKVLPATANKIVAVFGDSLTVQAWDYIVGLSLYGGLTLIGDRFSGTALCDWRDGIEQALTTSRPSYLVFGFAGNNVTECTGHRVGAALGRIYERDARAVVQLAEKVGTHIIMVGPPDMGLAYINRNAKAVRSAFKRVADDAGDNVTFVDARDDITPDGYTSDASCKSWETAQLGCRNGTIRIRHTDKIHWAQPNIYGYSGGSWRWATTLFENVQPAPNSAATRD